MAGPYLPLETDIKKNYKFIWYIGFDRIDTRGMATDKFVQFRTLMNHVLTSYVSQMAEKVSPPDDEIDYEDYQMSNVNVPVPKGVKMPDITVTYLDDTNDAIYNFHKSWQSFARDGDSFSMNPLYPYCVTARYITFENTLTVTEYATLYNALNTADSYIKLVDSHVGGLDTTTDLFMKPRSIYNYPNVFPIKIARDEADKSGESVSKVTVTYKRLPNINKGSNYTNLKNMSFFVS